MGNECSNVQMHALYAHINIVALPLPVFPLLAC